jgi:hypothetical protein
MQIGEPQDDPREISRTSSRTTATSRTRVPRTPGSPLVIKTNPRRNSNWFPAMHRDFQLPQLHPLREPKHFRPSQQSI